MGDIVAWSGRGRNLYDRHGWSDEQLLATLVEDIGMLAGDVLAGFANRHPGRLRLEGLIAKSIALALRHGGEQGIDDEVRAERDRQNELHPGNTCADDIPNERKLTILAEEVGEVARALQEGDGIREEAIQVAAVCVAWLEAL